MIIEGARRLVHLALAISLLAAPLLAQRPSSATAPVASPAAALPQRAPDGSELTISVLTFGQGDALWERFGHNALRIRDAVRRTDVAYNWGTFDFAQPNFIGRFLTGNTLYWLDTASTPLMIEYYRRVLNRSAVEQVLALTPEQAARLRDFAEWNLRPENRNYRYDYFIDNCSTRLRDAIDRAVGGQLKQSLVAKPSTNTFRSESLRLVDGLPFIQAGMHIALGEPADAPMTAWEEAFVPMRLRDRLREVQISDARGTRPLVGGERVIYEASRAPESTQAPTLVGRFLTVGLLLSAAIVLFARRAMAGSRGGRIGFATVAIVWGVLAGIMGLLLTIAWTATRHIFWFDNENLFQLLPLALGLVVLVPLALSRPRWRGAAFGLATVLAASSLIGLLVKPLPMFQQRNIAVVLLALPVQAVLLWALWQLRSRAPREPAAR